MALLVVKVIVELPAPGEGIEAGLKLTVVPEGNPVAEKLTADPLCVVVMVELTEAPDDVPTATGEAVTAKVLAVTVKLTVALWVFPPPVAVTAMG